MSRVVGREDPSAQAPLVELRVGEELDVVESLHAPVMEPRIVEGSAVSDMEYVLSKRSYTPEVERTVVFNTEKVCSYVPKDELTQNSLTLMVWER